MTAKKKILHVEDDRNMQLLVRAILEKAGYEVATAVDAMQGVMMARNFAPNLIVLDIMLPAGGGQSVLERVRTLTSTSHVPILIYSATPKETFLSGASLGEDVYFLQKPSDKNAILAEVRKLLGEEPPAEKPATDPLPRA
jgi:DNA-binding response OmpR family regulator